MPTKAQLVAAVLGGGAYVGPLDLVPGAAAAYSVARKLRSNYSGSLVRLREDAGNTEADFSATPSGVLNTAMVETFRTAAGATDLYVVTVYDQSGNNRNLTQATSTKQPKYAAAGLGSKPSALYDGTDDNLAGSNYLSQATLDGVGASIVAVVKTSTNAAGERIYGQRAASSNTDFSNFGLSLEADGKLSAVMYDGAYKKATSVAAVGLGTFIGAASVAGGTLTVQVNAIAAVTAAVGAAALVPVEASIGETTAANSNDLVGHLTEIEVYTPVLSTANLALIRNNQNNFYAVF